MVPLVAVTEEDILIAGGRILRVGGEPVVTWPALSRKRKMVPVTTQYELTISEIVAWPAPSSFRPATRISKA